MKTTSFRLPSDVLDFLADKFYSKTEGIVRLARESEAYQLWAAGAKGDGSGDGDESGGEVGSGSAKGVGSMGVVGELPPLVRLPGGGLTRAPVPARGAVDSVAAGAVSSPKVCQRCGAPEESGTLCFDCAMDGEV